MPWRESCAMDERVGFIADHRSGSWTMTELCERYEISRKTGYKWLERYRLEGAAGLQERSHAARVHGRATPQHIVDAIVGLRRERPRLGPRKIVNKTEGRPGDGDWPAGLDGRRDPQACGTGQRPSGSATCATASWATDGAAACQSRMGARSQGLDPS